MGEKFPLILESEHLETARSAEWIETNGKGGFASSTLLGNHSRRYHGLLIVNRPGSLGRDLLLSRLDESLEYNDCVVELSTRTYKGVNAPDGESYLKRFTQELYPEFLFEGEIDGKTFSFSRSLMMLHGENSLLLRYQIFDCPAKATIYFEPFAANRFFHGLKTSSYAAIDKYDWNGKRLLVYPGGELPRYGIQISGADFQYDPDWYYQFFYEHESERGQGADEDLYRLGKFQRAVAKGETFYVSLSTENSRWDESELASVWSAEEKRRKKLSKGAGSQLMFHLEKAARSFLITRTGEKKRSSVIAGYHWFADWGRDTMIALPGLCLRNGDYERAREILVHFATHIKDGIVPNRFSDIDGEAEYNSVDASLWFIVNGFECHRADPNKEFLQQTLLPAAETIISSFQKGTRYEIQPSENGLLTAGSGIDQLTWMDARVGDWVVTPRHGKAVEINALWCNAHFAVSEMLKDLRRGEESESWLKQTKALKKSFSKDFWNEDSGGLYDVIQEDGADPSIRPNQIFALSLPLEMLSKAKAKSVLNLVERELLTPRGLRTLSPNHPDYKGVYRGGILERDGAYHQGTVWPWLLGPYSRAVARYGTKVMKQQARDILLGFEKHLAEHGVGTVSEIFDGDFPHKPRGCISQAWSVSEVLCGLDVLGGQSE